MSDLPNYEQDSKIQFVIDAVYAFAHALDALKSDICPTWKGACPAMIRYDGGEFYKKYLLKVDFEGKNDLFCLKLCPVFLQLTRHPIGASEIVYSVTRLGEFRKLLATNFLTKVAQLLCIF